MKKRIENKYEILYSGPHTILQVNDNGIVRMKVGGTIDTYNIRRLTFYLESSDFDHGGECSMQISKTRRRPRLAARK